MLEFWMRRGALAHSGGCCSAMMSIQLAGEMASALDKSVEFDGGIYRQKGKWRPQLEAVLQQQVSNTCYSTPSHIYPSM